jgi:hypothetical protein
MSRSLLVAAALFVAWPASAAAGVTSPPGMKRSTRGSGSFAARLYRPFRRLRKRWVTRPIKRRRLRRRLEEIIHRSLRGTLDRDRFVHASKALNSLEVYRFFSSDPELMRHTYRDALINARKAGVPPSTLLRR